MKMINAMYAWTQIFNIFLFAKLAEKNFYEFLNMIHEKYMCV